MAQASEAPPHARRWKPAIAFLSSTTSVAGDPRSELVKLSLVANTARATTISAIPSSSRLQRRARADARFGLPHRSCEERPYDRRRSRAIWAQTRSAPLFVIARFGAGGQGGSCFNPLRFTSTPTLGHLRISVFTSHIFVPISILPSAGIRRGNCLPRASTPARSRRLLGSMQAAEPAAFSGNAVARK